MVADATAANPAAHLTGYKYQPGENGRHRRGKRFLELLEKLSPEFGELSAFDRALLEQAVGLMAKAERTADANDKVRLSNAGARILLNLHKARKRPASTKPRPSPASSLQEVLSRG